LPKLTRKQRRASRLEKILDNPNRPQGDNRGWQVTKSGGFPVWQLVEGGQYRIFVDRNLVPE